MFNPKFTIVLMCLPLLFSCALHNAIFSKNKIAQPVEEYPSLVNIKKVYIDRLGNEEGVGLVSEKIRLRMMKSMRFSVVEVPEPADAILKGVAGVERSIRGGGYVSEGQGSSSVKTTYTGFVVLRLVDAKTSETIWSFEYRERCRKSASSCVADATVDKLIQDAERADDKAKNDQSLEKGKTK